MYMCVWKWDKPRKIPKFNLISWYGNFMETHSFRRVSGESHENLEKLRFCKISIPGNYAKLWNFMQWYKLHHLSFW